MKKSNVLTNDETADKKNQDWKNRVNKIRKEIAFCHNEMENTNLNHPIYVYDLEKITKKWTKDLKQIDKEMKSFFKTVNLPTAKESWLKKIEYVQGLVKGVVEKKNDLIQHIKDWNERKSLMPDWLQEIVTNDDELVLWNGLDTAIMGLADRCGMDSVLLYDYNKMVEVFMVNDGMTDEEATEWVDFNIVGAYVGAKTPLVFYPHMT